MMIISEYPGYDHHCQQHLELLEDLESEIAKFSKDETDLETIINFIINWFTHHTIKADKLVGDHIKAQIK